MEGAGNILLGAIIASIVPIITLLLQNSRWKKEKRIEHLRRKHENLEKIYGEILEILPGAVKNNAYPTEMISKIKIYASDDARRVFDTYIQNQIREEAINRRVLYDFSEKANEHLVSIEKKIEDILS